ncbi:NifU family protein [Pontibacter diazotrophicus]|uniref:NifU family protein n=1 Tax=Pontibacter diazotrophicus TaxID=1400979 RepID=A0A3D8L8R7_9BACT|nr:NifU family protein [Pontibacter diazotrophicus]RDV13757.1 NifU family protein [Pontibacter diazotrophicus]
MAVTNVDQDFMLRVEDALDQIRPYLEADGGNVKVLEITEDMVLKLELLGACGSCPMSTMTLKAGVEQSVLKAVPEIKSVEAVNVTPLSV